MGLLWIKKNKVWFAKKIAKQKCSPTWPPISTLESGKQSRFVSDYFIDIEVQTRGIGPSKIQSNELEVFSILVYCEADGSHKVQQGHCMNQIKHKMK